jgi:hypothetical protein
MVKTFALFFQLIYRIYPMNQCYCKAGSHSQKQMRGGGMSLSRNAGNARQASLPVAQNELGRIWKGFPSSPETSIAKASGAEESGTKSGVTP